jgi:hypothetical protein
MEFLTGRASRSAGVDAITSLTSWVPLSALWPGRDFLGLNCPSLHECIGNQPPKRPFERLRSVARQTGRGLKRQRRQLPLLSPNGWPFDPCLNGA